MVELCRKSNYRVRNYSIKSFCFENYFGTRKSYRVHFIFIFYITLAGNIEKGVEEWLEREIGVKGSF
jgi:hypothetical protein